MADRALYLARTLMTRMMNLEAVRREDGARGDDRPQRMAVIEKVFAVELGITESATISLIESAMPHHGKEARHTEREVGALADFLRHHLRRHLAEP